MFEFLKPKVIYVKIHPNRFIMKRIGPEFSAVTLHAKAPFSSDSLLIADVELAIEVLKPAIQAAHKRWEFSAPLVVFDIMDLGQRKYSQNDLEPFIALGNEIGAMRIFILTEDFHNLTDEQVRQITEGRTEPMPKETGS